MCCVCGWAAMVEVRCASVDLVALSGILAGDQRGICRRDITTMRMVRGNRRRVVHSIGRSVTTM